MIKIFQFSFLFSILFSVAVHADLTALKLNNQGVDFLKNQNYLMAQEKFIQALAKEPFLSNIHFNLALSFYGLQQVDKAEASYLTAIKLASDEEIKFMSYFNLGEMFGKIKNTELALKYYQEALRMKPDSQETKINIELLIQQQQQQDQKGQGQSKDQQDQQDEKDKKDQKDKQDSKGEQEKKDEKDQGEKEQDQPKQYGKNKPQPKEFKSEELSQNDVNKILGELKQQEQKIRAEFNKKAGKEKARDKDW